MAMALGCRAALACSVLLALALLAAEATAASAEVNKCRQLQRRFNRQMDAHLRACLGQVSDAAMVGPVALCPRTRSASHAAPRCVLTSEACRRRALRRPAS